MITCKNCGIRLIKVGGKVISFPALKEVNTPIRYGHIKKESSCANPQPKEVILNA